ncbi:RNA binding protein Pym [Paecilomyces variotii No. 5]|uniref:RNA binding protein Pym n=1 Tax=Byssochlamys spectabilis (strain No. 5 / NBRC 109023) TaxID=1356009 RepID=V5FYE3_BYSSN|nr:RNA binding protein Pym [Paecilomyces variotii No. 5]
MTSPNPPAPTAAGITVDAVTGERLIPSSVRADGSKRREIRIRPGYRPPEDVELYKNRSAEAWKNRGKAGIPGAEGIGSSQKSADNNASAASNKNAKKREAKKRAKAATGDAAPNDNPANEGQPKQGETQQKAEEETVDPEAEKEKKARALRKKLRQARDLREKKDKGESLLPEQLEKVIKIQELIRQLNSLGFDADGEKKLPAEGKEQD